MKSKIPTADVPTIKFDILSGEPPKSIIGDDTSKMAIDSSLFTSVNANLYRLSKMVNTGINRKINDE